MKNETKKCKYCQTDIPKKAKICPNCKKKQHGKKKIVILIAVILIIIIAMASCNSCMSGYSDGVKDGYNGESSEQKKAENSNDVSEKSEPQQEEQKEDDQTAPDPENDTLTVGSTLEKNGLKITIDDANTNFTDYEDEYGFNTPNDGMKYVMASFTFENTGKSDEYVSIYDFKCYADNTECEQVYSLDDSDFINTNLSSGRNVSFKTYYSVPADAQTIELEYETNMWSGEKAIIKLQ